MSLRGRRGFLLLVAAVVAAASLGVIARVLGRTRLRFPYETGALTTDQYAALAATPGWRASRITVAPGIVLNGLVRSPRNPDAPWVLFYQGNDATMLHGGQAYLAALAADRDWGLAVYAYRGYDSSAGAARLAGLAADAPEILEQFCSMAHIARSRVHLVGFSIGGHLAVRAMAAASRMATRPASLTMLAAVDDIVMVPRSLYARLDPGDHFQTQLFLGDIPAPVLVIQGAADEALRGPGQGRAIAAALGARARYAELAGVGHVALLENESALAITRAFIEEHSN